jgi:cellulose biosynthesis protein BcsQ
LKKQTERCSEAGGRFLLTDPGRFFLDHLPEYRISHQTPGAFVDLPAHFQELVFKTVIQRNVKLSEAPSHGLPVILYDADSTGAKNHLALAQEIIFKNRK